MKEKWGKILLCICEALVGVLLLIKPVGFTTAIITVAGVVLVVVGLISIVRYFKAPVVRAHIERGLATGLSAIVAGVFCILRADWFIATFPILTMLYGVVILFTGIGRIQWMVDLIRMKMPRWYLALIGAVLSLALAAVILSAPFSSTAALWMFVAISLIVEAVVDLLITIFTKSTPSQPA